MDDDEKRREAIQKLKIAERWGQLGEIAEEMAHNLKDTTRSIKKR